MSTTTSAPRYFLTKKVLANGWEKEYQIKDESGNVLAKRKSARDYVAATISGRNYFSRMDLVQKSGHSGPFAFLVEETEPQKS